MEKVLVNSRPWEGEPGQGAYKRFGLISVTKRKLGSTSQEARDVSTNSTRSLAGLEGASSCHDNTYWGKPLAQGPSPAISTWWAYGYRQGQGCSNPPLLLCCSTHMKDWQRGWRRWIMYKTMQIPFRIRK
jgi:hypothetical protein